MIPPTTPPAETLPVVLWQRRVGAGVPFEPASLAPDELADCARRLRPDDAALCRESRFLLRGALAAHLGAEPAALRFVQDEFGGKPRLDVPATRLRFNLSHSAGLAVLAVVEDGSAEPGIDVEGLDRPIGPALFGAALSPPERTVVEALAEEDQGTAFLRLWTMKEAVAKVVGLGLAAPLAEMTCQLDPPGIVVLPAMLGDPADYALLSIDFGAAHVGALALRDPLRRRPLPVWRELS